MSTETMNSTASPPAAVWKISGPIRPARLGPLYQLGTVVTALAMVLLPLLYLGLIIGVGWAVYTHAVEDAGIIKDKWSLFIYAVPLIVGPILIIFMVKPLFARREKPAPSFEITRQQQPQLFSFIEQICKLVRAPRPRHVVVDLHVNASASFTRGFPGLVRNDLTLTIGLPLVTGLSVRELGGVLAHEFGHFAQGAGMRLTYVIRSVNGWFSRVVYERDSWDAFLRNAAKEIDIRIGIIFYIAQFMVWLTRKILWVFMWAGHGISCFMLRQMEFDADHYETQVAGSEAFIRTCKALPVIGAGWQRAVSRQQESYSAKRLVDDLATYTAMETQRVSAETRAQIVKSVKGAKTGWFDTHPTDFDRMKAAHHAKADGVLSGEESATVLFGDFAGLARQATAAYYQHECEIDLRGVKMVPLEQVAGEAQALAESEQATQSLFQDLLTLRTLFVVKPEELRQTSPAEQLQAEARAAIARHEAGMVDIAKRVEGLLEADQAEIQGAQAQALLAAGFSIKPPNFGLKSGTPAGADAVVAEARAQITQRRAALTEPMAATRERLVAGLRAYFLDPRPETLDAASVEEVERLTRIIGRFQEIAGSVVYLRNQLGGVGLMLRHLPEQPAESYVNVLRAGGNNIAGEVKTIADAFERLEYPFDHAQGKVLLPAFLTESEPHADVSVQAYLRGQALFDRLIGLYQRIMGRLAQLALRGEKAIAPKEEPEPRLAPVSHEDPPRTDQPN